MKPELIQDIAVTCELAGIRLSDPAKAAMVKIMDEYPPEDIALALERCRRESKGKIADIISRIDDGRPGAEEAWGMLPKSEAETAVLNVEMAAASINLPSDKVAARMTFKETYARLCRQARDVREPVNWTVSLGHATAGRVAPIRDAMRLGRISDQVAKAILSPAEYEQICGAPAVPELPPKPKEDGPVKLASPQRVSELVSGIVGYREEGE